MKGKAYLKLGAYLQMGANSRIYDSCRLSMASAMLKDPSHTVTDDGVHCSDSNCVLPMCINSKLGKLISNGTDNAGRAENVTGSTDMNLQTVIENGLGSATTEGHMELWWRDLESLGVLELPPTATDAHTDLPFLHGQNNPPKQMESALKPCLSQGMQLVRDQPHSWMGEEPRSLAIQDLPCHEDSMNTSRQIFAVKQPMATSSSGSSHFDAALLSQDSHVMAMNPLMTNIPSQFGINEARRGLLGCSGYNDKHKSGKSGKLFEILSLIFQAFDGPHTAHLEEYYASALQKALNEIQAAKSLCE